MTATVQSASADEGAGGDQTVAGEIEAAVDWQAYVPTDIADHLATMDRAARDSGCGVPWQLLAAIARVESDFGRNMATSSAGAIGYGQFLPSSWQAFGSNGNAYDYRDALPAIALYLCQAGLERDPRAALFAYNHADWYVDMVLNLAVRYDRMAPGEPVPDVLDVGPSQQPTTPMHYATTRDVRLQARARTAPEGVKWLGVPWQGRTPGQPIGPAEMVSTALSMVRGSLGLSGATPLLASVADAAWSSGLLPLPTSSIADIRLHLLRAEPVVALVDSQALPGHPRGEDSGEQPLVLIGTTPTGLIYSDPAFSSSLGYGLELSDTDFQSFWDRAAVPHQALAFIRRPGPPRQAAHLAAAEPPRALARVTWTPTPLPSPTQAPPRVVLLATATREVTPSVTPVVASSEPIQLAQPRDEIDASWLILVGTALSVVGAFVLTWVRHR